MICKYCKMEVPEGYRYCPNCGLLLDLGKQFTAPERKYTIPKYEYQPKKAEAEAAAPETTQQFLQPQHEESTEEAEARLELELRKALERDARAQEEAAKKPTEAVEFSDEDYAQVEQDDTPDAIELEEKQPAEVLVESVTLESPETSEPVEEALKAEAAEEVVAEEAEAESAVPEDAAEEAAAEIAAAEAEPAAESVKDAEDSTEKTIAEEAAAETAAEEPVAEMAETEAVEEQADEEPSADTETETEEVEAGIAAETATEDTGDAAAEPHSDLEEKIAALLPDDGLDSTKVDEQGNPAFVWDENISFMEAVSEKSVGDFAVEEDEKAAETCGTEQTVDETATEPEAAVPVAELEAVEPAEEPEAMTAESVAADAETEEAPADGQTETEAAAEAPAEPEAPIELEGAEAETESALMPELTESAAEEQPTMETTAETAAPEAEAADKTPTPQPAVISDIEDRQEDERSGKKKRFLIPVAICAVAAGAIVVYLNLPAQRMSRALTKGRNYVESNNFTAAVPVLEKLLQEQPDSLEVHVLLSEAYANTDRHAQAVALLEEAKAAYPDNAELLEKLAELNPAVTVSVPSGEYSDPQSIALSNEKGYEIRYQLNDEPEQTYDDEILLSTNGDFTLSAYAVAADGAKGESVSMMYTIKLNPEKYPLDQFVSTTEGTQYIDADGAVQTGWMTKDGKTYYFDEKGYMQTGLQTIDDATYFFDADGVMSTGWQEQGGKYYFFDEKGQMLTDTWIDNQYYVGEDGAMLMDTTTPDGVYVNARGQKGFDAASEFANYPNSIVEAHIGTKVDKGDYYEVSASVYHQKSDNKPAGESYDITLKVLKHAKVHYLDNNLPDIIASDAFSFLKEIGMQKIQQDNEGYVTEFSFALGEKRS